MDDINRKIIKHLQQNGRMSTKSLADILSLTPPVVAERMRKLEERNVILGYTAIINQDEPKNAVKAIINTTIARKGRVRLLRLQICGKIDSAFHPRDRQNLTYG